MIKALAFIGGLCGATGLSQFPEFSQQYLQRLGGAVDGLRPSVVQFDRDAANAGVTRTEALRKYQGAGGFLAEQGAAKAEEIGRFEALDADYRALKEAAPLQRLAQVYRLTDPTLIRSTWSDFRPAVPVTIDGFICAAIGYGIVWVVIMGVIALITRGLRRRISL